MITSHRSRRLALLLIVVFIFLHRVVVYEPEQKLPAHHNG